MWLCVSILKKDLNYVLPICTEYLSDLYRTCVVWTEPPSWISVRKVWRGMDGFIEVQSQGFLL